MATMVVCPRNDFQRFEDLPLVLRVELTRCFVEHEQGRASHQRPRQGGPLALAAGEPPAPVAGDGVQPRRAGR